MSSENFTEIEIWAGQRKLMPISSGDHEHVYHCHKGSGYIRQMSQSHRLAIEENKVMTLSGDELVTLTSREDMKLTIICKKAKE